MLHAPRSALPQIAKLLAGKRVSDDHSAGRHNDKVAVHACAARMFSGKHSKA